jgi:hypothetical protein
MFMYCVLSIPSAVLTMHPCPVSHSAGGINFTSGATARTSKDAKDGQTRQSITKMMDGQYKMGKEVTLLLLLLLLLLQLLLLHCLWLLSARDICPLMPFVAY